MEKKRSRRKRMSRGREKNEEVEDELNGMRKKGKRATEAAASRHFIGCCFQSNIQFLSQHRNQEVFRGSEGFCSLLQVG